MKSIYGFIPAAALVAVMGLAGTASAKDCKFVIEGSDAMKYNLSEIDATGCAEVSLTLNHSGKLPKAAMGHNWVLSLTSDKKKIVDSATAAVRPTRRQTQSLSRLTNSKRAATTSFTAPSLATSA